MLLSAAVGVVAGVGAIIFQWLVQACQYVALVGIAGFPVHEAKAEYSPFGELDVVLSPWLLLVVLGVGGLLAGYLTWRFAPEATGHGTDAAIDLSDAEVPHRTAGRASDRVRYVWRRRGTDQLLQLEKLQRVRCAEATRVEDAHQELGARLRPPAQCFYAAPRAERADVRYVPQLELASVEQRSKPARNFKSIPAPFSPGTGL